MTPSAATVPTAPAAPPPSSPLGAHRSRLESIRRRALMLRWQEVMGRGPSAFGVFCQHFIRIATKDGGAPVAMAWNRIQAQFEARRTGWDIVLKARQVGFTTLELARDLWFATTREHVRVVVVVPPHKTRENAKRIIEALDYMRDRLAEAGVPITSEWVGSTLNLSNGSRLTVYDTGGTKRSAEKVGRGGTHHRVHISELAHLEYGADILNSLLKTIPGPERGGEFVAESTANGAGGAFHELWQGAVAGANGLTPHFFAWFWMPEYTLRAGPGGADDAPAEARDEAEEELLAAARAVGAPLTTAQLRWWRQQVAREGADRTLQEYPHDPSSCFLLSGSTYFDRNAIKRLEAEARVATPLTTGELERLAVGAEATARPIAPFYRRLANLHRTLNRGHGSLLRVWEPPKPGRYLIAVDCAEGGTAESGGDWLVAVVLHRTSRAHVATLRARVSPAEFARWVEKLALAFGEALVVVERNGHGGTVLHVLHEELQYPHLWRDAADKLGWWTGPSNRLPAIDDLADALLQQQFTSPDPVFASEARTFVRKKTGKVEHENGCNDDVVMATVIGWAVLCGPRPAVRGPRPGLVREVFG